jgi:hypothetical protein
MKLNQMSTKITVQEIVCASSHIAAKPQLSRKILFTEWRATIRSVLKVVYFLRMKKCAQFGIYFSIPIHNLPQSKVSKYS